jgi:glycogen synthase
MDLHEAVPRNTANSENPPTVAVLTFSRIMHDQRVLRQCAVLADTGHIPLVIAYGFPDDKIVYPFERWPVPQPTTGHRLHTVARQLPAHLGTWAARLGFWAAPCYHWALNCLRGARPGVVIANDWPALVVAAAYKAETGALIHYDTHEFATLEFDEQALWRLVYKPIVTRLERLSISSADSVSTVGPNLAQALQVLYRLEKTPAVVRNTPNRMSLPGNTKAQWPLRILYHGYILPDRGIEALITSTSLWKESHRLIIRGCGGENYIARLRRLATVTGKANAISFEAAVEPTSVVRKASQTADVGAFFTPLKTIQRDYVMPNKLFEYVAAGLAVVITPAVDMKAIVESHDLGIVSANAGVVAIADAVNQLTPDNVARFRANSRKAAAVLCWEEEKGKLLLVLAPLLKHI